MATNFAPSQLTGGRRPVAISEEFFEVSIRVTCFHTALLITTSNTCGILPDTVYQTSGQTFGDAAGDPTRSDPPRSCAGSAPVIDCCGERTQRASKRCGRSNTASSRKLVDHLHFAQGAVRSVR
eukprot:1980906-Prymnesium_polylepis.1